MNVSLRFFTFLVHVLFWTATAFSGHVFSVRATTVSGCDSGHCQNHAFLGSAVMIGITTEGNTILLTCKHTWEQGTLTGITVSGRKAKVITNSKDSDLALIEVEGRFDGTKPFILGEEDRQVGQAVHISGFEGQTGRFASTQGSLVTDKNRLPWQIKSGWPAPGDDPTLVNLTSRGGYSGGAVSHKVDGEDILDGIIVQTSEEFNRTLYVPVSKVTAFLERVVEAKLCCRCWQQGNYPQPSQNVGINLGIGLGPIGGIQGGIGMPPPVRPQPTLPPQIVPISDERIAQAVENWLSRNQDALRGARGPAGPPGKDGEPAPFDDTVARDTTVKWLESNIGKLRGPAGEPGPRGRQGSTGQSGLPTDEQVSTAVESWMNRNAPAVVQSSVVDWMNANQDRIRGPQGKAGPQGPRGDQGPSGTVVNILEMNGNKVKVSPPLKSGSEWHIPIEKIFSEPMPVEKK